MKTILIPTDFSDDAGNAADYAAQLGKLTNSKLILFHAYQVPVPSPDGQIVLIVSFDDFEKDINKQLEKEAKRLHLKWGVEPKCITTVGYTIEEILRITDEVKADLIVMGTHGSNKIEELLLGSNTTGVIHKSKKPIFAIPRKAKFRIPEKIVFACDFQEVSGEKVFGILNEFANLFKSKILVLNVNKNVDMPTIDMAVAGVKLEKFLEAVDHSFHFSKQEDVVKGINDFVESSNAEIIAMIPHKHSIFKRFFSQSITNKIAFHTNIPLLVLTGE